MRKQENKSLGKRKKIYKEVNKALFLVEEKIYFKLDFYQCEIAEDHVLVKHLTNKSV